MLFLSDRLKNIAIMSLQTGTQIARADNFIIDPRQLKIVALYVNGPMVDFSPAIITTDEIRELSPIGCIVDSSDNIVSTDDLVRLQEIINFDFELIGLQVIDTHKNKLGKVADFAIEDGSFFIQRLHVKRPLIKSLNDSELVINRAQVVEVNNQRIVVNTPTVDAKAPVQKLAESFENPFKKSPQTQPES